jgi:hypothetical protein
MITNTDTIKFEGRTLTTYIRGTVELTYFDLSTAPEEVIRKAAKRSTLEIVECDYSARIEWADRKVIVTIGDYIIAEWIIGDKTPIKFTNDQGYGDQHAHSYIIYLPADIISDVMGHLWPAM